MSVSMACVTGATECNGCMRCYEEPKKLGICSVCHDPVYSDDEAYCIDGEYIHDGCLREWAKQYEVET